MTNHPFMKLYVEQLRDLYNAEKQLTKAIPQMAKAATSSSLKSAFNEHLKLTKKHVERLDTIFKALGRSPNGKTCKAMAGLISEGKELLEDDYDEQVLDAGLIGAAQKIEHYEIAAYGTLRAYAELMGETEATRLLWDTLQEEGDTNNLLTRLALEKINTRAVEQVATA
ncbi:MAG: ferritin-like domain-containing protein [Candidatus Eisenbacteria bacterium]